MPLKSCAWSVPTNNTRGRPLVPEGLSDRREAGGTDGVVQRRRGLDHRAPDEACAETQGRVEGSRLEMNGRRVRRLHLDERVEPACRKSGTRLIREARVLLDPKDPAAVGLREDRGRPALPAGPLVSLR